MHRKMVRPQKLAENIVLIDGFSNAGKSLIAPVISSFDRCELWRINYLYEHLCIICELGMIDRDAASSLIKSYSDLDIYNLMIGRDVNFREDDDSGVSKNLLKDRYKERLIIEGGDNGIRLIKEKNLVLILMTHYIFGISDLLFESFDERLKVCIVMLRHPLHLILAWYNGKWHERDGKDPRDFQPCYELNGEIYPWYAYGWEAEYHRLNPLEKAIKTIGSLSEGIFNNYEQLANEYREKVIFIPFEKLLTNPDIYINQTINILNTKKTPLTKAVMKTVNLPRKGEDRNILELKEKYEELSKREKVSNPLQELVGSLSVKYEEKYLI